MSNLSRRSIVASATALPALAVPAAAIPALGNVDDDKLVTLAAAVEMAWDDKLPAALNLQQIAEVKMWEWKKKNPHPLDVARPATPAAIRAWEERNAKAKRTFALDEVESAVSSARNELDGALDAMCETPARSLRGVIAKARALQKVYDGSRPDERFRSIVNDLLAMRVS
jgi:hypothetical protein